MYDDDYGTCRRTFATLLIYPVRTDPEAITVRLGIEPTFRHRKGEPIPPHNSPAEIDLWCLSTKGWIESRDSRRHIDWLLDAIEGKAAMVRSLQEEGARIAMSCFWLSQAGQGGPTISPGQMRRLGGLNLELWFDVYFDDADSPVNS